MRHIIIISHYKKNQAGFFQFLPLILLAVAATVTFVIVAKIQTDRVGETRQFAQSGPYPANYALCLKNVDNPEECDSLKSTGAPVATATNATIPPPTTTQAPALDQAEYNQCIKSEGDTPEGVKSCGEPPAKPTTAASSQPSAAPTPQPTALPTAAPTPKPASVAPTPVPTVAVSALDKLIQNDIRECVKSGDGTLQQCTVQAYGKNTPTSAPTAAPTPIPTKLAAPTSIPTAVPTPDCSGSTGFGSVGCPGGGGPTPTVPSGPRQVTAGGGCCGAWDCGNNSYCAGAACVGEEGRGACIEGANRPRTAENVAGDYCAALGQAQCQKALADRPQTFFSDAEYRAIAEGVDPKKIIADLKAGVGVALTDDEKKLRVSAQVAAGPTPEPAGGSACGGCGGPGQGACDANPDSRGQTCSFGCDTGFVFCKSTGSCAASCPGGKEDEDVGPEGSNALAYQSAKYDKAKKDTVAGGGTGSGPVTQAVDRSGYKYPNTLKPGAPGCISCNYCGGFCADPGGGGCKEQALGVCPGKTEKGETVIAETGNTCFNPDGTKCVNGLYGVKEVGGTDPNKLDGNIAMLVSKEEIARLGDDPAKYTDCVANKCYVTFKPSEVAAGDKSSVAANIINSLVPRDTKITQGSTKDWNITYMLQTMGLVSETRISQVLDSYSSYKESGDLESGTAYSEAAANLTSEERTRLDTIIENNRLVAVAAQAQIACDNADRNEQRICGAAATAAHNVPPEAQGQLNAAVADARKQQEYLDAVAMLSRNDPKELQAACRSGLPAAEARQECRDPRQIAADLYSGLPPNYQAYIDQVRSQDKLEDFALSDRGQAILYGTEGQIRELCKALAKGPGFTSCNNPTNALAVVMAGSGLTQQERKDILAIRSGNIRDQKEFQAQYDLALTTNPQELQGPCSAKKGRSCTLSELEAFRGEVAAAVSAQLASDPNQSALFAQSLSLTDELANYQIAHPGATQEQFMQAQVDALGRIEQKLKDLGQWEGTLAKVNRGELLATDVEKTINSQNWFVLQAATLFNGALLKLTNQTKYEDARVGSLLDTQSAADRQVNVAAILLTDNYKRWLGNNPKGTPEQYQRAQIASYVRTENDLKTVGVIRDDTKNIYINKVLNGQFDNTIAEGQIQAAGGGTKFLLGVGGIVGEWGRYNIVSDTSQNAQREWGSELTIQDFSQNNPAAFKATQQAIAQAHPEFSASQIRDFQKQQLADGLAIIDEAKNGDLPKGSSSFIQEQSGWIKDAAIAGQLDMAALRNGLLESPPEVYKTVCSSSGVCQKVLDESALEIRQADILAIAFVSSLSPETQKNLTRGLASSEAYGKALALWKVENPGKDAALFPAQYQSEQMQAYLLNKEEFASLNIEQSLSDVLSGKFDAVGARASFAEQKKNPGVAAVLAFNRFTDGAAFTGSMMQKDALDRLATTRDIGERGNAIWDYTRGTLIMSAKPASIAVMIAAPFAAPVAFAIAPVTLTTSLTVGGTALGVANTFNSLGATAEQCSFDAGYDKTACAYAAGMTVFSAASTAIGAVAGEAQLIAAAQNAKQGSLFLSYGTKLAKDSGKLAAWAEQATLTAQSPGIQFANRAVAGSGALLFGGQAVDTCSKEGLSMNCAMSAGMALVSAARFAMPAPSAGGPGKFARSVDLADDVVNGSQAVVACGAAIGGGGTFYDCSNALAGAALSAGSRFAGAGGGPGGRVETPEQALIRTQQAVESLYVNGKPRQTLVDGGGVPILGTDGKPVVVTPEILRNADFELRKAILAVGQERAEVTFGLKPIGGKPETWTETKKAWEQAQNALRTVQNPDGTPKSGVSPEQLQAARNQVVAARQTSLQEQALMASPRSAVARLGDRIGEALGIKQPAAAVRYQEALSKFEGIAINQGDGRFTMDTSPGREGYARAYAEAAKNLGVAKDAVIALGFTKTQQAINEQIKPKLDEQRQLVTSAEAVQKEIAVLEQNLKQAQENGSGVALAATELANKQVALAPLSQKYDALATEIKTLEARLQAAGTIKGRLAEAVEGTAGTGIVTAITTPISSGLFRAGKALDVAVQNLRSASRGQTVERVLVDEVSGKNLNWFEQRQQRSELNAIDKVAADPGVDVTTQESRDIVVKHEANARGSSSLRELTRTILQEDFGGQSANTAKAKAYAQELWMRTHPEDPAVAVRVAGGVVGAVGADLDVVIRRQIADGVRGIIDQVNSDGRFTSADGRVEGVRRRIGTMVDSLFEGDAFHPSVRDALQTRIEAALAERFPGIGAQELQGHAASVYRELAARYAVDPDIRATFVRDFSAGVVLSGEQAGFLDQGRSGGTWRPTIGDPGVYAKFEVPTASEISGAGEMGKFKPVTVAEVKSPGLVERIFNIGPATAILKRLGFSVEPKAKVAYFNEIVAAAKVVTAEGNKFPVKQSADNPQIYRLDYPENASKNLKQQIDSYNTVLDQFESQNGFYLRPEQVDLLLRPEAILQLQAGGGKSTVIGPMLAVVERTTITALPTSTDATSYVNDIVKNKPFFDKQGVKIYFYDEQRGFLEVGADFDRTNAKVVDADAVKRQADLAARDPKKNGLMIITEASDAAWGQISGRRGDTVASKLMYDFVFGTYDYTLLYDEIGSVAKGQYSKSRGEPTALANLQDSKSLQGVQNASRMLNLSDTVQTIDSLGKLRTSVLDALRNGRSTESLFFEYVDENGVRTVKPYPKDEALIGKSYAELLQKAIDGAPTDAPIRSGLEELRTKLDRNPGDPAIRAQFESLLKESAGLTPADRTILTELAFMTSDLQARWFTLSRIPGNDFGFEIGKTAVERRLEVELANARRDESAAKTPEAATTAKDKITTLEQQIQAEQANRLGELVLRKSGGTTGETYSAAVQKIALHQEGAAMLEAARQPLDRSRLTPLEKLAITPDSDQISSAEIMRYKAGRGKLKGYDATPDTAANALGIDATGKSERPPDPSNFVRANDSLEVIRSGARSREHKANVKDKTPAFVLADDRGAPFSSQTDVLAIEHKDVEFVSRTKFITEPDGGVRSEYFIERVVRNTDGSVSRDIIARPESAEIWSAQTHQYLDQFNASGTPGKLMIVYEGRTRAVDFKVLENSVNNKNIRFTTIASDMNSMEDITQSYKRNRVPAREADLLKAGWTQGEIDNAKQYELWVRTKDSSLTADTAIDRYQAVLAEQLAVGRFEGAVQELGKGPEKALTQARENLLRTRPPAEHEAIRRVFGEKIADAQRIERAQFMEIQTNPLSGTQIPTEIYTRGKRAYDTLSAQVAALQSEFRMSNGEIQSLRLTLGVDTPYIARADFDRLYQEPHLGRPTNANPVGPSAMVRYWAEMNDPATLPKAAWSKQSEPDTTKLAQDAAKTIEEAAKAVAEKPFEAQGKPAAPAEPGPASRPGPVPAGPAAPVPVQPGPAAPAGPEAIAERVRIQDRARLATIFPQTFYLPEVSQDVASGISTNEVISRAAARLAVRAPSDISKPTFDSWAREWATDMAAQALVPSVAANLAAGRAVTPQDLYLAWQGAYATVGLEQTKGVAAVGKPQVGTNITATDPTAPKVTVALSEGTKIEFGHATLADPVYPTSITMTTGIRPDVAALSQGSELVRLTTPDGKRYSFRTQDFLSQMPTAAQEQLEGITAAVEAKVIQTLTTTSLAPSFIPFVKSPIPAKDLATVEGQALVSSIANVQAAVIRDGTTSFDTLRDSQAYQEFQNSFQAFRKAKQPSNRNYKNVNPIDVLRVAIVAVDGPGELVGNIQQIGRVTPGVAEPSDNVLVRLWQRLTDFGNFFIQATGGLPTFFRRINGEAVRDLFLWKPLSGLMTSPRVPQRTKNILAGGRDGVAEVVFNAAPFGIGRSNWNLRNAAIDTAAYFFTRNIPYAGVVLSIYDGARIVRWVTEKVSGVQSPLRIQPPAPAAPEKPTVGGDVTIAVLRDEVQQMKQRIQAATLGRTESQFIPITDVLMQRIVREVNANTHVSQAQKEKIARYVIRVLFSIDPSNTINSYATQIEAFAQSFPDLLNVHEDSAISASIEYILKVTPTPTYSMNHSEENLNLVIQAIVAREALKAFMPEAMRSTLIALFQKVIPAYRYDTNDPNDPVNTLVLVKTGPDHFAIGWAGGIVNIETTTRDAQQLGISAFHEKLHTFIYQLFESRREALPEDIHQYQETVVTAIQYLTTRGVGFSTSSVERIDYWDGASDLVFILDELKQASVFQWDQPDGLQKLYEMAGRGDLSELFTLYANHKKDNTLVARLDNHFNRVRDGLYYGEKLADGSYKKRPVVDINRVIAEFTGERRGLGITTPALPPSGQAPALGPPKLPSEGGTAAPAVPQALPVWKKVGRGLLQYLVWPSPWEGGIDAQETGFRAAGTVFRYVAAGWFGGPVGVVTLGIVDGIHYVQDVRTDRADLPTWVYASFTKAKSFVNWGENLKLGQVLKVPLKVPKALWTWLSAEPTDEQLANLGVAKEDGIFGRRDGNLSVWINATPWGMGRGRAVFNAKYAFSRYGWAEFARWMLLRNVVGPLVPGVSPVLTFYDYVIRLPANIFFGAGKPAALPSSGQAPEAPAAAALPPNWQTVAIQAKNKAEIIIRQDEFDSRKAEVNALLKQEGTFVAVTLPDGTAENYIVENGKLVSTSEGIGGGGGFVNGAPAGPAEAPRVPPIGPAISQVLASRNINLDRLQSLPNAATIISFITRRFIDPGFQKVLPVAQLPQDLVIYENDAVVSAPRHQEILANYQNNRPGLPIFSSFALKGLIAAGYQAVNLDIRNLGSANEVGGSPNGIVGDYLIYDTIAAIQKELGEDYLIVRTGGDEFTVVSKQPATPDVTARIQTAVSRTSSLFKENGKIVYKPSQVKVTLTSPADLAEADARALPPEELSPGLRMNRLNVYHPELRLITDAIVTIQDQAEVGNFLAFFEEALFDPVLQKEAQQLSAGGKNVEVYVNRTDYINHLQSRSSALRLVRIDLPGALKRMNDNHNYTIGNAFLTYEFRKIVGAVAKYQNNVIVFRRGGDFYVALPDNQDLVNAVSGEIERAIRGESGSFQAEEERITLIPALASVKLNLELVKERTPEVSSTNERAFAVGQEQLAQEVWRATIMQLQRFYSVEHRSPDWEFLLRYLDPYDRRGNNRLVRMATPFIADLQKFYYDPAVDGRSGVREGQVEAAKQQLLQILNGYQYPQPPLDVTGTQTKIKTFESRVPAPLRLVRVGQNYITGASELIQRVIADILPSRKVQDESRFIPRSQEIEPLERDNFSQNRDSAAYNELKDSLNFIHQNYRFYRQDDPTVVELQGHLDRLIANINEERAGQKLKPIPKVRLLITANDKWPNAVSYFDGTVVLNQSLINLLHTPGEIMAILTHEVSHFEDHFLDWSAPIEKLALGPILVNRMQEYKADLVKMSRRLKKLGFSGLSMKRALEALSGYYQDLVRTQEKKPAKRINDWFIAAFKIDTPPEVEVKTDLEHGSIANRILLQILSSYVLEVGGEDVVDNRTIPENWKRLTTQDTPYEQLLRERNQSRWEQLFRVAPPLVVRKYAREYPNLLKQSVESSIAWQEVRLRYRKDRPQQAYNALRYRQAILNFENLVAKRKIIAKVFLAKRDLERLLLGGGRKAPYNDLSLTIQKLQKFAAGFSSRWYLPDGKQITGELLTLLELRDEDFTPEAIASLEDRASWKPIFEKLGMEFTQDYQPLAVLYADFQTILHHQDILTKRFGKAGEIGVPIVDLYERYLDYLLSLSDPEEDHFILALATANNIVVELYARETLTYNQELADRGVAVYRKILQKYPQKWSESNIYQDLVKDETFGYSSSVKYLDKLQYYKRWGNQLGLKEDFSEEEDFYLTVQSKNADKLQALLRYKPLRVLDLTKKGGQRNVFETADWDWIKQQYGNFIDSSDYHSANWANDENMPVHIAPFDFEYRVKVDWTSENKERIEKARAVQQKYQTLLKSIAGAEGLRWVFGRYMGMTIGGRFSDEEVDYYLSNTAELHTLLMMQIAREWIVANVAAGNISARVGYHAASDLLKNIASAYRGTMPFVGRNQVEAAYLQPIIVFYLQEIRRSMPADFPESFITANEFYQTVKELPASSERDALLDDMRLAMVKKLPFADVLRFVRNELDEEDGSADVVSYFLENRIQTYDEYSEAKGYFGENFINDLSHKSSAKLGLGVILDTVMSNILQPDTAFEFFEAAMTGNDLKLREIVAKEYYTIIKGRKLRENGIELTEEDKLVGPLADTYPLLNELMEEIYAMPKAKKFLLLTKLLVDDHAGVLHQEKNYPRIVALVMGRMENDPKVNPLLRKVILALLNQRLGKEKVALGVANSILDVFLQRPKNLIPDKVKDNNGQTARKVIDKQYEVMDKIPFWVRLIPRRFWPYDWQIQVDSAERQQRQQKEQTTRLARLFNVSRVDVLNDPENRDPVIVSLRSQIQNTIRDLGETARPLAERPQLKEAKVAPDKITAVSAIIQVAQALGAVGVRFLQVLGQYYPIDLAMQKEFQNVYDNASFLYMANAFQTTEQALRTYEEEIVRLENGQARSQKPEQDLQKIEEYSLEVERLREYLEKMFIIEKIGGGSIVTVYKTTMITPDGRVSLDAKDADVFKITNPNILERLEDDLGLIRSVVAELLNIDPRRLTKVELNPQKRQEYITARRLLNTLGDWIGEDVKDPHYLTLDSIYSATHKNYVAPNGMRVDVSKTKAPYNRWVKVEGFVDGATLNSLINELTNNDPARLKDLKTPEAQRARKTVQALVYDYTRHLFEPVDLPDGRKAVVTHSDIHAGNVITSKDKDVATLIDRNYYLVLQPQDILLIQHLFGGKASDREKLASLIN